MTAVPARTFHARQRVKREFGNNSVRRTYDLLRFSLHHLDRESRLVEEELVDALSASRNTVRAALRLLADEGHVTRRTKTGTTVAGSLTLPVNEMLTVAEFGDGRAAPTSRLLDALVIAAPEIIRRRLGQPTLEWVLILEGVLLDDGEPFGLSVSYLALDDRAQGETDVSGPDAIAFLEALGVTLGTSCSTVGAASSDVSTSELLDIPQGSPLVWLEDLVRDVDGRARALCQFRFRSDRVAFTSEIHRRAEIRPAPAPASSQPPRSAAVDHVASRWGS